MKKHYAILFFFFLLAGFFVLTDFAFADCDPPPTCPNIPCITLYGCADTTSCSGIIQRRTGSRPCWPKVIGTDPDGCNIYDGCECGACVYNAPVTDTICPEYAKCVPSMMGWNPLKPSCVCRGDCLNVPENPKYYNNLETQTDVGNADIKLPVKLDWDNVNGAKSYIIRIEGKIDPPGEVLGVSEYMPSTIHGPCFLESDFGYNWHVKACCNVGGTSCGPESSWNFTTNWAPELFEPGDPDWEGSGINSFDLDLTLKWCDFRATTTDPDGNEISYKNWLTYRLLIYEDIGGVEQCHPLLKSNGDCDPIRLEGSPKVGYSPPPIMFPNEKYGIFTNKGIYSWQISICDERDNNMICSDYSQKWKFRIEGDLDPPQLYTPRNGETVGLPVVLRWAPVLGALSYRVLLNGIDSLPGQLVSGEKFSASYNHPPLQIITPYAWKVRACSDSGGNDCYDWSTSSSFTTTGRSPDPSTMKPEGDGILIPVTFEWEKVPGAASYLFEFQGNISTTSQPNFSLSYPDLKPDNTYSWRVKTCAFFDGSLCGPWSTYKNFKTFKFAAPENPFPPDGGELFTYDLPTSFYWKPIFGAKSYEYELTGHKDLTGIVKNHSFFVRIQDLKKFEGDENDLNYNWRVRSCFDENCQDPDAIGEWNDPQWSFILKTPPAPPEKGLVPCGRTTRNPDTPWHEDEPCELKHLFILLYSMISFVLFRLALIVFVLLILATGCLFFLNLGTPELLNQVKSMWRIIALGYAVIFLAWVITGWLLSLFGYQVGIFSNWWEINF